MLIANATSIKVLRNNVVLAAVGNVLYYFYIEVTEDDCNGVTKTVRLDNPSLPRDKIHDLDCKALDENEYFIIGRAGYEVIFTTIHNHTFSQLFKVKFNDWIVCTKFSWNPRLIFVLTAHNKLAEVKINFKTGENSIIRRSFNTDSATLYTATIDGELWDTLFIFSGTALGEINIWRPTGKGQTRLRLTEAHNGVIFSISVDFRKKLMVTTSDDRSVQLWNFDQLAETMPLEGADGKIFFERKLKIEKKLKKMFGHIARVFCSKIIEYSGETYILSAGEDSRLCVWSSNGQLVYKKDMNSGGIWGLDYCDTNQTCFVSRGNGSLAKIDLRKYFKRPDPPKVVPIDCGNPVKLCFLKSVLIILSDLGYFVIIKNANLRNSCIDHEKIQVDLDIQGKKVCSMKVREDGINLYLLTIVGDVAVYKFVEDKNTLAFSHKKTAPLTSKLARSIHFPNEETIMVTGDDGHVLILTNELKILSSLLIPKCSEPWATVGIT